MRNMPTFAAALFVIYSLLAVSLSAQNRLDERIPARSTLPGIEVDAGSSAAKTVDFKKVFDEETKKFNAATAKFDPDKWEREREKQVRKKGLSKTDKTLLVLFAAGISVLVVLLVKYGKNCAQTNIPNCNIGEDNCYCERYEAD